MINDTWSSELKKNFELHILIGGKVETWNMVKLKL